MREFSRARPAEERIVNELSPNTPVIIGAGFCQQKLDDPAASTEPYRLMMNAIRQAAQDAGATALATQIESIAVLKGMWEYRNPGRLIASELGCPEARSILVDVGNLQLSPLFELCAAIREGEQQLGVVTGGEAKFRELRAKITGQTVANTREAADTPPPDVFHSVPDPFSSDVETRAGIMLPVEYFAVIESALRHAEGLGIEEHRDRIAALYGEFSRVAARNPHAWSREEVPAAAIRNASASNAMIAFPYTKRVTSQWNVNQAAAVLVCSVAKARALGLDESRWIYPLAATQNRHVVVLAQKRRLHTQPGTVIAGERACALAGITARDVSMAELYSCFPAAVRCFARDLALDGACPLSVTGSMAFAGGPFNHAALDGVVGMAEALRRQPPTKRSIGLVSNLSGIFGKEAVLLLANRPGASGFAFEDVTERVAAVDRPVPTDPDYHGPARIVGYTVAYVKNEPSHAYAYCENAAGARTVARSADPVLIRQMTESEFVGREVLVREDHSFSGAPG
jgi:acetyl-CoA C-acetyltransferase